MKEDLFPERFNGRGRLKVDARIDLAVRRGNIEQIERLAKEASARGDSTVSDVPTGLLLMVTHCALNGGYRSGEGKGRIPLSSKDKQAREAAKRGAPELFVRFLAAARAAGERDPEYKAREQTAWHVRKRMIANGVKWPPAVATLKKKLRLRT